MTAVDKARLYFGLQAIGGALWWVAVFTSDDVRAWTLGGWEPAVLVVPDVLFFVAGSAVVAVLGNRYVAVAVAIWTTAVTVALVVYGLIEQVAGWGVVTMVPATVGSALATTTIWLGRLPLEWFFVGPFAFHVADEATGATHLRRSLVQVVVFWTTFYVIVPLVLVAVENRLGLEWAALHADGWAIVGAVMFVGGTSVGLWSCVTMAVAGDGTPLPAQTTRNLVVTGPYRYVRNPMAVAGAAQTVGVGLWCGSWMVIAIGLVGALVWNEMIRPSEEADLAARFGEPYLHYSNRVRCWVPGKPWTPVST